MTTERGEEWILATTNVGKLAEYRELLAGTPIALKAVAQTDYIPEETGSSFVENALIKARHAAEISGQPAMADDSGLCVAALGGAPGVRSARYAGSEASDHDNLMQLLAALAGFEGNQRRASFHCVIVALQAPDDPAPLIADGRWPGLIAADSSGINGFGYDPVFFDPDLGMTAAELEPAKKNAISHRSRACKELKRLLGF